MKTYKMVEVTCYRCGGTGKVESCAYDGDDIKIVKCDTCNGSGRRNEECAFEVQTDEEYNELVDKFHSNKEWIKDALINERDMSSERREFLKDRLGNMEKPKRCYDEKEAWYPSSSKVDTTLKTWKSKSWGA